MDGGFNTALGAGTLVLNSGGQNTAIGAAALLLNTTGFANTAVGATALLNNAGGSFNTATGTSALQSNTTGDSNTANGISALRSNTSGFGNTANGESALRSNTSGNFNTATGISALQSNTTGGGNTAIGLDALIDNLDGSSNTALGGEALEDNISGVSNTAIGRQAGALINGSNNVCIGAGVQGLAGVDNTTWIKNVYPSVATARIVYVDSNGKLGTLASSRRFKDEIKSMDKTSEAILALEPVTFRYKKEIDHSRTPQFGLIAEEVAEVNPNLVTRDDGGQPQTVRYDAINAMLLNEFLKEHRKVEKLEATVAQQRKDFEATTAQHQREIKALTANLKEQASQIQKVSAQVELQKAAPQTVLNKQ